MAKFDQAKAAAAVDALENTIQALQSQFSPRDSFARKAMDQWSGPDADTFRRARYPALKTQMGNVITHLSTLAQDIGEAADAAAGAPGADH